MTDKPENTKARTPEGVEKRGVATDLAVTFAQGAAAGAGAAAGHDLYNKLKPKPRPAPPKIELPPGVEK